jgi:hypothetical protein
MKDLIILIMLHNKEQIKMTNPLQYNDHKADMPDDCIFKISPSQFPKFADKPHFWYRSEVLGIKDFEYNTSTVLGTVVHYCADQVAKQLPVDTNIITEYIESFEDKEDYDPDAVKHHYVEMAERLVNDYVLENAFLETEKFVVAPIRDGYYIGGQLDALQGEKDECMIVDYKTYHSKTTPRAFNSTYRYQLLTYAAALVRLGYTPTRIRLVYVNRHIEGAISEKTGKQLKSYPPTVTVLTETITEEDYAFINSLLELCVDSVEASKAHPELTHVIWHDQRLKEEK